MKTKENIYAFLLFFARIFRINLLVLAYKQMGILNFSNNKVSGEEFVIGNVLKKYVTTNNPVFFDVGANVGEYSLELRKKFQDAKIYSFEPSPVAYNLSLVKLRNSNIDSFNCGLGSEIGDGVIYDYNGNGGTVHASVYKEVIIELHGSDKYQKINFKRDTVDNFCKKNQIHCIDFLKIDTEGSELEVLKGSLSMLSAGKIKIIQFEFNEMNVISRVFLKDFYQLLKGYNIYRVNRSALIPIFEYKTQNEIFKFQNLLAIQKN